MVKIWDPQAQVFRDAETPKIWNAENQAWKESTGLVWNETAQAWEEKWSPSPKILYLYKDGNECVNITGGWRSSFDSFGSGSTSYDYDYKIIRGTSGIIIKNAGSEGLPSITTRNAIDVYRYNKLSVLFDCISSTHASGANYQVEIRVNDGVNILKSWQGKGGVKNGVLHEMNISSISKNVYVSLNDFYCECKIYAIWLEE